MLKTDAAPPETVSVAPPVLVPLLVDATAAALVGLDRRPPPSPLADDPIGPTLARLETNEPPVALVVDRRGEQPLRPCRPQTRATNAPPPPICPSDDQPVALPAQAARLRRMLNGENADCLPEWVELLATSGRRVPDDSLVDLLNWSETQGETTDALRRILGHSGNWLAALHPKWRKRAGLIVDIDPATLWETGTLPQRVALLRDLRDGPGPRPRVRRFHLQDRSRRPARGVRRRVRARPIDGR